MKIEISLNWLIIPILAVCTLLLSKYLMIGNWNWYYALKLPPITPPGWLISNAWQIIYVLTTVCALIVYNFFSQNLYYWIITGLFSANIMFHVYWNYLFFNQHLIGYATLCAAALTGTTWGLMWLIGRISWMTSLLLVPYALWGAFATFLNFWIWLIN